MEKQYKHQSYPSVRYHKAHGSKVVSDESQDKALGAEWHDCPDKAKNAKADKPAKPAPVAKPAAVKPVGKPEASAKA